MPTVRAGTKSVGRNPNKVGRGGHPKTKKIKFPRQKGKKVGDLWGDRYFTEIIRQKYERKYCETTEGVLWSVFKGNVGGEKSTNEALADGEWEKVKNLVYHTKGPQFLYPSITVLGQWIGKMGKIPAKWHEAENQVSRSEFLIFSFTED